MFTQSFIDHVNPPAYRGNQVWISWVTTQAGLTWQIYIDDVLSWASVASGINVGVWLAVPTASPLRIDVGSVDPSEIHTSFASSLPSAPARRVLLSWQGGTFEADDLVGFHIYQSPTAGTPADLTKPVADIKAYPGIVTDGFGLNKFGAGGFGQAAGDFSWESNPLTSGVWSFAVRPYDLAGNEGAAQTTSRTDNVPPLEVPMDASGRRLTYVVDRYSVGAGWGQGGYGLTAPGLAQVTLSWLQSLG